MAVLNLFYQLDSPLPYSLWNGVDYANLGNMEAYQDEDGNPDQAKIDQEKYKWLEFYKIKFKGTWYTRLVEKLVLRNSYRIRIF